MNLETIKAIIVEGQELLGRLEIINREFRFESQARYVFVGIRQAGKSYLLYLRARQLMSEGHDIREMLFVNFDDERLIGFSAEDLDMLLRAHGALFDCRPILFLDEIQNVEGWEHFVRRLANQKYMVYVTGSNAKMLSREIASTLGGRYVEQRVFPYSFHEFLAAHGVEVNATSLYGSRRTEIDRLLDTYFQWGGFPELVGYVGKRRWLNELYEKILLGDVIQRWGIRNEKALRLAMKRLAENIKTPTSYNRLANMVKAIGVSTNATSIMDYVNACRDSCIIFPLENYASKFVEKDTVKKHYFVDNGLLHIFLSDSDTALLENICAVTLHRRCSDDMESELYFYNKEVELDFYIPAERRAIQASFSISDADTRQREVRALTTFHKLYGLDRAEIVTYSEETQIEADGLTIRVVPLAKWLLENT